MKILIVVALAFGCAISLPAQTVSTNAPSASDLVASSNPSAEAAWKKINDDSDHVTDYLHAHDKDGLASLAPAMLKELRAFVSTYPDDVQAPQARLLAVQVENLEQQLQLPGAPNAESVRQELNGIADDTALPQTVRAQAALMALNSSMDAAEASGVPAALDDLDKRIGAFQKEFGSVVIGGPASGVSMLREEQIALLKAVNDSVKLDALLARLVNDPDSDVAMIAKKEQASQLIIADLKAKPMALTFTALDGKVIDLAKLRGKVVLIDFWATWCGPCVAGMPEEVAVYQKYHRQGFEIIGISLDQDKTALQSFITQYKMPWPEYFDGKGWDNEISSRFDIGAIPAMWLIGRDGKLAVQSAQKNLGAKVAQLLLAK
jgi:thiol-disulfide isomerase/thioredoxin